MNVLLIFKDLVIEQIMQNILLLVIMFGLHIMFQ